MGADEFAAALAGRIEKIELPRPGQWVRQGQKILSFYRNGEKTEMVSPTEVRSWLSILKSSTTRRWCASDPYGKGWLVTVNVPDEESTTRNLIPKGLVHEWMRLAVDRLSAINRCWPAPPQPMAAVPPRTCWLKSPVPTGNRPPASSSSRVGAAGPGQSPTCQHLSPAGAKPLARLSTGGPTRRGHPPHTGRKNRRLSWPPALIPMISMPQVISITPLSFFSTH